MLKRVLHKYFHIICAVFVTLSFVFQAAVVPVLAETNEQTVRDYRKTSILQDLSDVNVALYPKNVLGKPKVILMQEYCYSEKAFFSEYYAVVVYVYNPTETELNVEARNTVNMALTYDAAGKPASWHKVDLTYLDKTENNRFYKFEVSNWETLLPVAKSYAELHEGKRRYDFADIEFVSKDGKSVTSTGISRTYYFSGYAAGCGESDKSTLKCETQGAETIQLEVKHTNYRTMAFSDNVCDELNSVYFSVPDRYFEDYGNLQKIKAEWYEYKTDPIFVTSDADAYDALYDYIGEDIGQKASDLSWSVIWHEYPDVSLYEFAYIYNYKMLSGGGVKAQNTVSCIDWLFERENVKTRDDYALTAEEVEKYMSWYTSTFGGVKYQGYSAELFSDSVDAERTRGYNVHEIDAGDKQSLTFYDETQTAWNKFWRGQNYVEGAEFSPILTFTLQDLATLESMDAETFSKTYYVNAKDAGSIRAYCIDELKKGNRPVIFRFALTDYYASTAYFDKNGLFMTAQDGYVAQETVFLDFDIISLTFRSELGEDTVIGVCAEPIDIINGTDPPDDLTSFKEWFKDVLKNTTSLIITLIVLVAVVCLIAVLLPVVLPLLRSGLSLVVRLLKKALNGIWTLIKLPFKLIGKLFKRSK